MVVGWLVGWAIVRQNQYDKHSAMRWHLFRYRISVNYYRLKWLKQYEHFRYAILLRNADDIPWTGIVVRLDWNGTNLSYFSIFDGISIDYVEIISRLLLEFRKINSGSESSARSFYPRGKCFEAEKFVTGFKMIQNDSK